MKAKPSPDFIKLEIQSIPPVRWTLEFKRDESGIYQMLALHHGLGMSVSETHHGQAREEHVAALGKALEAIQQHPQSGSMRVICDGNGIEAKMPASHFSFHVCEEGENGEAFQRCLRLACSQVLSEATYERWMLDEL